MRDESIIFRVISFLAYDGHNLGCHLLQQKDVIVLANLRDCDDYDRDGALIPETRSAVAPNQHRANFSRIEEKVSLTCQPSVTGQHSNDNVVLSCKEKKVGLVKTRNNGDSIIRKTSIGTRFWSDLSALGRN